MAKIPTHLQAYIDDAFPNTIVLALTSISFALFIGVPLGVLAAFYKDKIADKIISIVSVLGMSLPSFLAAVKSKNAA